MSSLFERYRIIGAHLKGEHATRPTTESRIMKTDEQKDKVDCEHTLEIGPDTPLYLTTKFKAFLEAAAQTFGIASTSLKKGTEMLDNQSKKKAR
jgi:hypothetical protein